MRTVLYVQISSGMGGASHSLMLLAARVRNHGYRPVIVGQQVREGLWTAAEHAGIPYYPLFLTSWARSGMRWGDLLTVPNRVNTVRRLAAICERERVSVVHTNLHFCLEGALAAKALGIPHVTHVREQFSEFYRRYWGGKRGGVVMTRRLSDRVICVSHDARSEFDALGLADATRLIPNAVDIPEKPGDYDPSAARTAFGLPTGSPIIGVFGALAARKGQKDLVRAMKALTGPHAGAHLAIVGNAVEDYGDAVRREADTLGLSDRVHFISHRKNVWPLLWAVDVVAVPSRAEGFGRIVVEGMGAGKPVVACSVGGIVDIVEDGKTGLLVPPGRPDLFAAALIRVFEDRALRERLASRGELRARTVYGPDIHVRRVTAVYDELLGG